MKAAHGTSQSEERVTSNQATTAGGHFYLLSTGDTEFNPGSLRYPCTM